MKIRYFLLCLYFINELHAVTINCIYGGSKCETSNLQLSRADTVDISGSSDQNNGVQEYRLTSSQIKFLSNVIPNKFPNLQKVVLQDNVMEDDIFDDGFQKIQFLEISKHNWEELKPISLNKLRNLHELWVIDGQLTTLRSNSLESNRKLKTILMINNRIKEIPMKILENLVDLEFINFGDNKIESLDEETFKFNRNLKKVFFYGNKLSRLPLNLLSNNPNLLEINFGTNQLTELDQNMFGNNQKLVQMFFYGNNLDNLDENMFINLRYLEVINFGDNQFQTLKNNLFQYNNKIRELLFYGNQFEKLLPEYFKGMTNLMVVNFGNNFIETLNSDLFKNNRKIKNLLFYDNRIQRLSSNLFKDLKVLTEVNFGDNQIEFVGSVFKNNRNLEVISLYGNRIRGIQNGIFDGLSKLRQVNLLSNVCSAKDFVTDLGKMSDELKECYDNCNGNPQCTDNEEIPDRRDSIPEGCGLQQIGNSFSVGGTKFTRGKWPWIAAMFYEDEFKCMGNLISSKHILTSAHCFQDKGDFFPKRKQSIYYLLGKNDLAITEDKSLKVEISKYNMHHDWDPSSSNYEGDIAVATLKQIVEFSTYIQPICITNKDSITNWFDRNGTVAGWGKTEDGFSKRAREVSIPIVKTETCLRSSGAFRIITTDNNFCAGNRDGKGPCEGDSGGGIFVQKDGHWIVLGLVSSSLISQGTCDLNNYVIFTNALSYYHWILSNY